MSKVARWKTVFSDMHGQTVYSVNEAGEVAQECIVEGRPGGIGFTSNGDLLVNEMERARTLRRSAGGELSVYSDLSAFVPAINDLLVTPKGHCYVGQFSHNYPAPEAPLLTIDPGQQASPVTEYKLAVANGMIFRPHSRTLIVAESGACLLSAFDAEE